MNEQTSRKIVGINETWKQKIRKIQPHLIAWTFKHESFKQELLSNPKLVIEKELGNKLPKNIEIKVLEENDNTFYMVIPKNPYKNVEFANQLIEDGSSGIDFLDVAYSVLGRQPVEGNNGAEFTEDTEAQLIARAWQDESFKQALLSNPKAAVEKEFEITIPEGSELKVLEEEADTFYIVLPSSADDLNFGLTQDFPDFLEVNVPMVAGSPIDLATGCGVGNGTTRGGPMLPLPF